MAFTVNGFLLKSEQMVIRATSVLAAVLIAGAAVAQTESRTIPGVIVSAYSFDVAYIIDGQINKIHFSEGQMVSEGDLLVELDDRRARLRLELARNKLALAKARHEESQADLERQLQLLDRNTVSKAQLSDTKLAALTAGLDVDRTELEVEMEEARLADHKFVSPMSGVISAPRVNEGSNYIAVETGSIATISQLDPVHVRATIPVTTVLQRLREGEFTKERARSLEFELSLTDGGPYPHLGRVAAIGFEVLAETGEGSVLLRFPNPNGVLRPGMPVSVKVVAGNN